MFGSFLVQNIKCLLYVVLLNCKMLSKFRFRFTNFLLTFWNFVHSFIFEFSFSFYIFSKIPRGTQLEPSIWWTALPDLLWDTLPLPSFSFFSFCLSFSLLFLLFLFFFFFLFFSSSRLKLWRKKLWKEKWARKENERKKEIFDSVI